MEPKNQAKKVITELSYTLDQLRFALNRYVIQLDAEYDNKQIDSKEEAAGVHYTLEDLDFSKDPLEDFESFLQALNKIFGNFMNDVYSPSTVTDESFIQEIYAIIQDHEELQERSEEFLEKQPTLDAYSKEGKKLITRYLDLILASAERIEADIHFIQEHLKSE